MNKIFFGFMAALLVSISVAHAQHPSQKPLDIYFIDTEGGQATLFVSPSGQPGWLQLEPACAVPDRTRFPDYTVCPPYAENLVFEDAWPKTQKS